MSPQNIVLQRRGLWQVQFGKTSCRNDVDTELLVVAVELRTYSFVDPSRSCAKSMSEFMVLQG